MAGIEKLEAEFVSLWEDIAEARGFERVLGRIICILLLSRKPLSQREVSEKSGYSVPTVSRALNTLTSLGSVRKTAKPGTRTMLYHTEMNPLEMISQGLVSWISVAKTMQRRMNELKDRVEEYRGDDPERVKSLIDILAGLTASLPKMMEIVEKAVQEIRTLVH